MTMSNHLNIVLHEPEIPQNTGNIARTCAVTGASLHLIEPLGFKITDAALKRAGLDYWDKLDIHYYSSYEDFMSKNDGSFYYYTTKAKKAHTDVRYGGNVYLIFGKETKGLPEELLKDNHDYCVRMPMRGIIRSLNLSNAVAIGTYEVLRQWDYPELVQKGKLHNLSWE